MRLGTVKWFNNKKGFGFIVTSESQEDVFVHYSAIKGDGFRTLLKGTMVEFEVERGPKGLHANFVAPSGKKYD
jgi:CspA family cold shock protein